MIKWIKEIWRKIVAFMTPKSRRVYRVIRCKSMPSLLGFKVYGTPTPNSKFHAIHKGDEGYREFDCILWKPDGNVYECHTRYLSAHLKRIK